MKSPFPGMTLFLCALIFTLGACNRDLQTAQGIVEEFVDQHYVYIDLETAKQYCVGLALHKINEEIRLTAGQVIDASTRKPKIYYRLLERKEEERQASFLFEGTIRAQDTPEFTRRWLIIARKEGGQWRVSNFTEY
jgi:outer membrane lipopolysaccharide assembly protein LptE/RlpB